MAFGFIWIILGHYKLSFWPYNCTGIKLSNLENCFVLPASSICNKIENVSHWGYLNLEKGAGPLCDGKCFLGDGEKRLSPEQHREDEDAYWDKRKNSLGILSLKGR